MNQDELYKVKARIHRAEEIQKKLKEIQDILTKFEAKPSKITEVLFEFHGKRIPFGGFEEEWGKIGRRIDAEKIFDGEFAEVFKKVVIACLTDRQEALRKEYREL